MDTVTQIQVAWELHRAGHSVKEIAAQVGKHRSTIYRWFQGIRMRGIRGYIQHYKQAKKGRRVRKTHGHIVQQVLRVRRECRECCGEKIVYLLAQEGIRISRSTVYRILREHHVLRKEFKGECAEGMHLWADRHRIARAYRKNEQAFIESFNGSLRREALGYPKFRKDQLSLAQREVDEYLDYYHHRRPHLSLKMKTPSQFALSHLP